MLTILLRSDSYGRRGRPFAPLGLGRQPDVVKSVWIEAFQSVLRCDRKAAVVLKLWEKPKGVNYSIKTARDLPNTVLTSLVNVSFQ